VSLLFDAAGNIVEGVCGAGIERCPVIVRHHQLVMALLGEAPVAQREMARKIAETDSQVGPVLLGGNAQFRIGRGGVCAVADPVWCSGIGDGKRFRQRIAQQVVMQAASFQFEPNYAGIVEKQLALVVVGMQKLAVSPQLEVVPHDCRHKPAGLAGAVDAVRVGHARGAIGAYKTVAGVQAGAGVLFAEQRLLVVALCVSQAAAEQEQEACCSYAGGGCCHVERSFHLTPQGAVTLAVGGVAAVDHAVTDSAATGEYRPFPAVGAHQA